MTKIPAQVMREAYDAEVERWGLFYDPEKATHYVRRCEGNPASDNAEWPIIAAFAKFKVAEEAFECLSKEAGHRAALRALAAMESTEKMVEAAVKGVRLLTSDEDGQASFATAAEKALEWGILAAAEEGEEKS